MPHLLPGSGLGSNRARPMTILVDVARTRGLEAAARAYDAGMTQPIIKDENPWTSTLSRRILSWTLQPSFTLLDYATSSPLQQSCGS